MFLGPCGGPREGVISYERGTPVFGLTRSGLGREPGITGLFPAPKLPDVDGKLGMTA